MSKLHRIVEDLSRLAEARTEKAYEILGARPGPGFDLMIRPEYPLNGKWFIDGLTLAGKSFVSKFWLWQPISNQKVAEMKKQAMDWNLKYETTYPTEAI